MSIYTKAALAFTVFCFLLGIIWSGAAYLAQFYAPDVMAELDRQSKWFFGYFFAFVVLSVLSRIADDYQE